MKWLVSIVVFSLVFLSAGDEARAQRFLPNPELMLQLQDLDEDGRISRDEFMGPPQRFQRLDADQDDYVTLEEMEAFQRFVAGVFNDADNDGLISRDEFLGPPHLFGLMDSDGDGHVTRAEAHAFKRGDAVGAAAPAAAPADNPAAPGSESAARQEEKVDASPANAIEISPLTGKVFGSGRDALIVMLHGGGANDEPTDHSYRMASRFARSIPGTTAVGLLRPGYRDFHGRRSVGPTPPGTDQLSESNNDLVAETIENLAVDLSPEKIILVGQSSGAAAAGAIAGRFPGLINTVILTACPCDARVIYGKVNQSPRKFLDTMDPATRIIAISGANDDWVRPVFAKEYVAAAKSRGLDARYIEVEGAGHKFRELMPTVMRELRQEMVRQ